MINNMEYKMLNLSLVSCILVLLVKPRVGDVSLFLIASKLLEQGTTLPLNQTFYVSHENVQKKRYTYCKR